MTPREENVYENENGTCPKVPADHNFDPTAAPAEQAEAACTNAPETVTGQELRSRKPRLTVTDDGPARPRVIPAEQEPDPGPDLLYTGPEPVVIESPEPVIPKLALPGPAADYRGDISAFWFSQRGKSHIDKDMPCQDRCGLRFLDGSLVIAAIADGVGSCALSDHGASEAVGASLDFLERELTQMKREAAPFSPTAMGALLRRTMRYASDRVEQKADEMGQLLYSFQSTLTVSVYNGSTLFYAHAGDDGIVVLKGDGQYGMVTTRHKGDEASSVYPLQARQWEPGKNFSNTVYGMCENVVAFLMVTDGVLDSFVLSEAEQCSVYYPFMRAFFLNKPETAEHNHEHCLNIYERMESKQFRDNVTDDITVVCVVNQAVAHSSTPPSFDQDEWNRSRREAAIRRQTALYPPKTQMPPRAKPPVPAAPTAPTAPTAPAAPAAPAAPTAPRVPGAGQEPAAYRYPPARQTPPAVRPAPPQVYQDPNYQDSAANLAKKMQQFANDGRFLAADMMDVVSAGLSLAANRMRIRNDEPQSGAIEADYEELPSDQDDPYGNGRR